MKRSPAPKQFSFESKLERLAPGIDYFGLSVPQATTAALQKRGPVPIAARFNGVGPYPVNLYPRGAGRHGLRVKLEIREAAKLKEGDRVRVQFTVRDRAAEITLPLDLVKALRSAGELEKFQALPHGMLGFTLNRIGQAAKPETRAKRIQEAVEMAQARKGTSK